MPTPTWTGSAAAPGFTLPFSSEGSSSSVPFLPQIKTLRMAGVWRAAEVSTGESPLPPHARSRGQPHFLFLTLSQTYLGALACCWPQAPYSTSPLCPKLSLVNILKSKVIWLPLSVRGLR